MTAEELLKQNPRFSLAAGEIEIDGDGALIDALLPEIRRLKSELIALLSANGDGRTPPLRQHEENAIRRWLAHIGETDQDIIDETLKRCRVDLEARAYFLKRADEALPLDEYASMERAAIMAESGVTCEQCRLAAR